MRIIGGELKGRKFGSPKSDKTRPMTDRDREALFNIIGDIEGLRVLDLYAGSAALGLEALSRGACHVDGVEIAKEAVETINSNIEDLGLNDNYTLYVEKVESWLIGHSEKKGSYQLILADPPFNKTTTDSISDVSAYLSKGGMFVLKHSSKLDPPKSPGLNSLETRNYGTSSLSFYRQA